MSDPSPLTAPSPAQLRRELIELVEKDLLGPAGGEREVLAEESPRDRYLVGLVAPQGRQVEPEGDEPLPAPADSGEEAQPEQEAAQTSLFPSSIGMSFRVDGECEQLVVTAGWGQYLRVENPDEDAGGRVWQREPRGGKLELALEQGHKELGAPDAAAPDVIVQAVVRRIDEQWSVTLFLRNRQPELDQNPDQNWLFQAQLAVAAPDGAPVFVARSPGSSSSEEEQRRLALAYRKRLEHGVGHSVAVHVSPAADNPTRAVGLYTAALPRHEVAQMRAPDAGEEPGLAGLALDMQGLGDAADGELCALLEPLPQAYGAWIDEQEQRLRTGGDGLSTHAQTGAEVIEVARRACARIEAGIALLAAEQTARDAFRFANRAMALQRVRSQWAEHRRRGGEQPLASFEEPARRSWYPFQLAFILLNLPSVTDAKHPERSHPTRAVCDLLWFPTGGGKTEAYLGLAAYVLALRRLQPRLGGLRADAGVAVLMRYTLRVLTLQQFQRASTLICACEVLRREDPERWGEEPFRIGLWVGQATTPNRVDIAAEALRNLRGDGWSSTGGGRPDQLSSCPWCGTAIEPGRDMRAETLEQGRCRVLTFCGGATGGCDFSQRNAPAEGLPVITVDEEIYRRLPALLIATVDKFAQLPWKGETQMLFGTVQGRCERHGFRSPQLQDADSHPAKGSLPVARTVDREQSLRPPDLIIQDELHLISGPLGTMVGHYETAIDRLMTWELDGVAVRPKVVASTATIRRARQQIHQLFLREASIFPPPSLDADNSFFARERPLCDEDPGRLYLGVCAPGRRLKAVLIRVYVAFLAAGQTLYERYGAAADPWMTLVGYFNAMQELAGMRRLCEDDIRTRLGKTDRRGLAKRSIGPYSIEELTSRLSARDIPDRLDHLERGFDPVEEGRRRRGEKGPRRPIDVLLATSMISVGVDVQRLGLMVVAGQPKTSAEYIQATSRVGRSHPGVVCTVYNWARPRDLSHYERFEHYHATYYAQVEPLSLTPFSKRAMDRGMSALLVALVRLAGPDLNPNAAAQLLERRHDTCAAAVEEIVRRASEVTSDSATQTLAREMLEQRLDEWLARIERARKTGSLLGYEERRDSNTVGLLQRPAPGPWHLFTVLNSLRDVEPSVGLVLQEGVLYPGGGNP
jgi:hypothetical protein